MKYLVSSNYNYFKKSYPFLIKSLINSGISNQDIYMVVGSCESDIEFDNYLNINLSFINYNSFEFNALIYAAEHLSEMNSDYFFLLHDTCLVGKNFNEYSKIYDKNCIIKKLHRSISMNIGLYSKFSLKDSFNELMSLKMYPKDSHSLQKCKEFFVFKEDYIFKKYFIDEKNNYYSLYEDSKFPKKEIYNSFEIYYHEFIDILFNKRRAQYIPDLDLYKFQANMGLQHNWIVEL